MTTTKYNISDFSQRLRNLRGTRTQGEFAEFLGFSSQQTYQNYERGRIPKPHVLQQIAQRTGVSIAWLMGEEDPAESAMVREDRPQYKAGPDYLAEVVKLAQTADLASLLDTMENLSKTAGVTSPAAAAVAQMVPIVRKRLDAAKQANQPHE